MAAGTSDFPTSLDTTTNLPTAATLTAAELDGDGNDNVKHSNAHGTLNTAVVQIETKLGTGTGAPAAAGKLLRATSASASGWSTLTFPDTAAVSRIIDASATDTLAALATANDGVLVTGGTGVPSISSTLPSVTIPTLTVSTSLVPDANDGAVIGSTTLGWSDLHLAAGAVINWANGEVTITETDAGTLTLSGIATLLDIDAGIVEVNNAVRFDTGVAMVAASYSIGRDADVTNQLHLNVPTGATFELSINDAVEMTLSATAVDFQNNTITTTGGGSLTGTWTDLGTVTTVDINGGTWTGVIDGASTASASLTFADDILLRLGTGGDIVLVER